MPFEIWREWALLPDSVKYLERIWTGLQPLWQPMEVHVGTGDNSFRQAVQEANLRSSFMFCEYREAADMT